MTVGMKRSMTRENDFSQSKRSRNGTTSYDDALAEGKYELRVLIPSKSAGAVIGKGGSFIKDIRSKVKILISGIISIRITWVFYRYFNVTRKVAVIFWCIIVFYKPSINNSNFCIY